MELLQEEISVTPMDAPRVELVPLMDAQRAGQTTREVPAILMAVGMALREAVIFTAVPIVGLATFMDVRAVIRDIREALATFMDVGIVLKARVICTAAQTRDFAIDTLLQMRDCSSIVPVAAGCSTIARRSGASLSYLISLLPDSQNLEMARHL